jgi:hypothetical protein
MNRYDNHNNNINQNERQDEFLESMQQHPTTSLDELRERVLNNPASFSTPPDSLSNPDYVKSQNEELLERFQSLADKITTDNKLAQEKLAETFQQYMTQHSSFLDSIMQWFSLTPFLKWVFIVGLAGLLGVSTIMLFKFFMSKSPKMIEQSKSVVTYRFLWGLFEYTKPYNVDPGVSQFTALKYFYKTLKYLCSGK